MCVCECLAFVAHSAIEFGISRHAKSRSVEKPWPVEAYDGWPITERLDVSAQAEAFLDLDYIDVARADVRGSFEGANRPDDAACSANFPNAVVVSAQAVEEAFEDVTREVVADVSD
jgi:hypothetical protein